MALEGTTPPKNSEKNKNEVVKGPLDIVQTSYQRGVKTGRRNILGLVAGGAAAYFVAEAATPITTSRAMEKVMPNRPADLPKEQREAIEQELRKFEEARKKGGAIGWAEKWWENAKKGYDKHGLDFWASFKEFSEEALRGRLMKYDFLKESYDTVYNSGYGIVSYVFYATYAAATFYAVQSGVIGYLKNRSQYEKDLKTQNAVNTGAAELEDLKAEIESLQAKMADMEKRPLVSPNDFAALIDEIKKLDTKASPILRGLVDKFSEAPAAQKDEEK